MADDQGVAFDGDSADRIGDTVQWVESQPSFERRFRRRRPSTSKGLYVATILVTSTAPAGGLYPGTTQLAYGQSLTSTGAACWIYDPNAKPMGIGYYQGRFVGNDPNGIPIFQHCGAGASENSFWAQITGGTNPYSWGEVVPYPLGTMSAAGLTHPRSGTFGTNPLYELNGITDVPYGTIARIWPGYHLTGAQPPPLQGAPSTSTSSGTLAAGTWYYVVTATIVGPGETAPSNEVSATLSAPGTITLNWSAVPNAYQYAIYRGAAPNAECVVAGVVSAPTLTFADTGAVPGSSPPSAHPPTQEYLFWVDPFGYTGSVTEVTAVSCSGSTLSVTTKIFTYQNGLLISVV